MHETLHVALGTDLTVRRGSGMTCPTDIFSICELVDFTIFLSVIRCNVQFQDPFNDLVVVLFKCRRKCARGRRIPLAGPARHLTPANVAPPTGYCGGWKPADDLVGMRICTGGIRDSVGTALAWYAASFALVDKSISLRLSWVGG
jgi:hypothetical protein